MSELKDIVLQKIGRNVVNFQRIEGMLKYILSTTNFKGSIKGLSSVLDRKKQENFQKTLGTLTKDYFKLFNSKEDMHEYPSDRKEQWISFSLKIENEEGTLPQQKAEIEFLVSERNRLIHQMLINFNPDCEESCKSLIEELDKQNEMILREYKYFQSLCESVHTAKKLLAKDLLKNTNNKKSH